MLTNKLFNKIFFKSIYLSVGLLISSNLYAVSFDCSKASNPSEKMVCGSPLLSTLDDQMFALYSKAKAINPNPESLKKDQMVWIKQMRTCGNEQCMEQLYKQRIAELSPANLTPTPQTIKTIDPAPVASNTPPLNQVASQEVKSPEPQESVAKTEPIAVESPKPAIQRAPQPSANSQGSILPTIAGLIMTLLVVAIPFIDRLKKLSAKK